MSHHLVEASQGEVTKTIKSLVFKLRSMPSQMNLDLFMIFLIFVPNQLLLSKKFWKMSKIIRIESH